MSTPTGKAWSRRAAMKASLAVFGLPAMTTALAACSPEQKGVTSDLTELLTRVSDLVLPATETPGAVAAGVPDYLRAVMGAFMSPEQQADFRKDLEAFDTLAHAEGAESFTLASADVQTKVLTALDEGPDSMPGRGAWQQLRDMVIFGFYTSEMATEELAFEEIPGRYIGDMPFAEVGRAWLTRGV